MVAGNQGVGKIIGKNIKGLNFRVGLNKNMPAVCIFSLEVGNNFWFGFDDPSAFYFIKDSKTIMTFKKFADFQ